MKVYKEQVWRKKLVMFFAFCKSGGYMLAPLLGMVYLVSSEVLSTYDGVFNILESLYDVWNDVFCILDGVLRTWDGVYWYMHTSYLSYFLH